MKPSAHKRLTIPLLLSALATLAPVPAFTASAAQEAPEEIEVTGYKQTWVLEREVALAEDKFYNMYNALNPDDDYDIHCFWDVPTGTLFRYRKCEAEFQEKALADYNQGLSAVLPEVEYALREEVLLQNLQQAVHYNPELAAAADELTELKQQLGKRRTFNPKYPGRY